MSNHTLRSGSGTAVASTHESSARVVTQVNPFKANVHGSIDCFRGAKKDTQDCPDIPHRGTCRIRWRMKARKAEKM